jgi:hypothetical protein
LQRALTSTIENKIALVGDVYSKPPIINISYDLHIDNIRGVVGDIVSYHERPLIFYWIFVFLLK